MTEHTYFSPKIEAKLYIKIGKIINTKFAQKIYDDDVAHQIALELEHFERTPAVQTIIQNMVHNRQLIIEHFF